MNALPELKVPKLPAEKFLPTIIVDSREQTPLVFAHLPFIVSGLPTGDYSVKGLEDDFTVERKTLSDLYGSLTSGRERFMRELQRMRAKSSLRLQTISLVAGTGGGETAIFTVLMSLPALADKLP